ncbi:MAG TPA: flagellar motor switch protein FliM [Verrucomicrobiae bacterium]|jgi:flagellar motor switch protein FliM|nr:flagellar motor switch protein FliM [Verrucomicrobiae bacterium]
MNPGSENSNPAQLPTDMDQLLAKVARDEAEHAARLAAEQAAAAIQDSIQPYDFRNPMLLTPRETRKLRSHQEDFLASLASRLSMHLRLEFSLKMLALKTIAYPQLVASWANPSHLTMFKMEPLRGVAIIEIQPQLAASMVDRLMGGSGAPQEIVGDMSEIERALLEQNVQLIIDEWCSHWTSFKALKPVVLGYENNGAFIQTASPDTNMLVLSLEAKLGECTGLIQLGFPYSTVEPLIRHVSQSTETAVTPAPQTPAAAAPKWNVLFNDVSIPVTAEWQGLEMTAGEIISLKVGDVLPITAECAQQVIVRLESIARFLGRPGTIANQWAVELTEVIK